MSKPEKKKTPLISVVIPVYNVEKYIDKCMESVLNQTYKNFEVILVDDGSTDNSGKICDNYALKDSRVHVYHKENGGQATARNYGVVQSNAGLISFVDSDDIITADYLEYLWYLMKTYDCKVSCAGSIKVTDGKKYIIKSKPVDEIRLNTEKALERICYTSVGPWARLYKKEILLNNPFPDGRIYEDLANLCKIIAECNYVVFSDKQIYIWVQREGSTTHNGINDKQFDIFWAANQFYGFIENNYPSCKNVASIRCIMVANSFLSRALACSNKSDQIKYFKIAKEFAKPHLKVALINRFSTFGIKVSCVAIWFGYLPYVVLWKIRQNQKKLAGRHE